MAFWMPSHMACCRSNLGGPKHEFGFGVYFSKQAPGFRLFRDPRKKRLPTRPARTIMICDVSGVVSPRAGGQPSPPISCASDAQGWGPFCDSVAFEWQRRIVSGLRHTGEFDRLRLLRF